MDATGSPQPACTGLDLRAFFPKPSDLGERPTAPERYALAVCAVCPIRRRCLRDDLNAATDLSDVNGVFGGLRQAERREIIRARAQAAKDTEVAK
ncbi:WhiB family transcriptional regulator [Streptomyces triticirhizae]|uniref:WhiB family transcriptional regulator n=2 Tax=Streptomyces triticirhizae TaxID=2483353 RepID=A0A3M2M3Q8_9ACTN|nr:WhiB family transcriptional regulator [Streptomyces triticirhizae]